MSKKYIYRVGIDNIDDIDSIYKKSKWSKKPRVFIILLVAVLLPFIPNITNLFYKGFTTNMPKYISIDYLAYFATVLIGILVYQQAEDFKYRESIDEYNKQKPILYITPIKNWTDPIDLEPNYAIIDHEKENNNTIKHGDFFTRISSEGAYVTKSEVFSFVNNYWMSSFDGDNDTQIGGCDKMGLLSMFQLNNYGLGPALDVTMCFLVDGFRYNQSVIPYTILTSECLYLNVIDHDTLSDKNTIHLVIRYSDSLGNRHEQTSNCFVLPDNRFAITMKEAEKWQ